MVRLLFIEPYYGGSHRQLLDTILTGKAYLVTHSFSYKC